MLQAVDVQPHALDDYTAIIGSERMEELLAVAEELRGIRVVHINATAYGGGVSELLRSLVPIYQALGIEAEWRVITGDEAFFEVTKAFHNALQGADYELTEEARETYLANNRHNASLLATESDVVVAHDPQPAALRHFRGGGGARWVWRCHIDTSQPDRQVVEFLAPFVHEHDALVYTLPEFAPPQWEHGRVETMHPAIDPLSPKNMELSEKVMTQIVRFLGVDPARPILTQVSRFDPWKDPLGVVEVYRKVREEVPGLQLALLGSMALDDPEGWDLYERIREEVEGDTDVLVATNINGVSNIEVNAFQRSSDVVIQKSIREGFGLVVSESLWKATPVVAGAAGGIPVQMPEGSGGFLVEDPDDYAVRVAELLSDAELRHTLGDRGRQRVRERFLITRLALDELRLLADLV